MAASFDGIFNETLREKVKSSKILVVGAGGIGCELLKNLVLCGFTSIEVIDLDTIDVSNLNRQFLFRKEHVGKSKAQVARDSALKFNPDVNIIAYHDSIMSADYGVGFFSKFDVVMNALDNRAARNHVNRMCLAADVPLIESGTAGYLGQVTVIKKRVTECYECQPKPAQKTYPGCTIRNTPSEPIHCIVWAKHLFNQLFGEADPDQDVSPDTEDPEAAGDAGRSALESAEKQAPIERKSTRVWVQDIKYDGSKLFNKFFRDDIRYLLSMANLWKKRRAPIPLDFFNLPDTDVSAEESSATLIRDQRIWSMKECAKIFTESITELKAELMKGGEGAMLVWDKDFEQAMNFVTSAANIRSFVFGIPLKSRFEVKSMAGSIIPAIATTNAIIAGLIVMEAFKILTGDIDKCAQVYLNRQPNPRKKLLVPCALDPPNPKCYVCSEKREVVVRLNVEHFTVKSLEEKVLKSALGMVAPDVEIDDGKGTILISSEEGETEENGPKTLSEFGIGQHSTLKCDDFLQEYQLNVKIVHVEALDEEREFELIGNVDELKAEVETKEESARPDGPNGDVSLNTDDDDDLLIMDDDDDECGIVEVESVSRKRKAEDLDDNHQSLKKPCLDHVEVL